jgi:acyl carrier protein
VAEAHPTASEVLEAVFSAIDQVNPQQEPARRVPKRADAVLFGDQGTLDSLGLITFAVALEDVVDERFGRRVKIMDEQLLGQAEGPLSNVSRLVDFLVRELAR